MLLSGTIETIVQEQIIDHLKRKSECPRQHPSLSCSDPHAICKSKSLWMSSWTGTSITLSRRFWMKSTCRRSSKILSIVSESSSTPFASTFITREYRIAIPSCPSDLLVVFREARRTNSVLKAEHMADTIAPLLKPDGTVSNAFPKNLSALFAIDRKWGDGEPSAWI